MRLIVCGARDFDDYHAVKAAIAQIKPTVIAHGTAKGVDSVADEVAKHLRITVRRYAPDGKRHGRFAKHIRNGQMLKEFNPDAVLAILGKPAVPGALDNPDDPGIPSDAGNYGAATIALRALKCGVPVYTVDKDRQLLKLPTLDRDRLNNASSPRNVSPENVMRGLIARAKPASSAPAPEAAPSAAKAPELKNVIGEPPYLETGPHGRGEFNPYTARLESHQGRSIHEAFTAAKIFENGATGQTPEKAQGRTAINRDELSDIYTALWGQWLRENPKQMDALLSARGIANVNAPKEDVCPAQTLWRIRQAEIRRRHLLRLAIPQHSLSLAPSFNTNHGAEPENTME
ncbi:DUF2493 domain-containing protein [Hyphomicrobium zavarzinii]|uniref:DUF2493 domain-containing protein n=1 Tax=Hyphomicrobium zavarzinii TaxID=48292 RepID=UPI0003634441|nr:DUF2493 domain-containing protein [Hyphomicrobium zavarzinii]